MSDTPLLSVRGLSKSFAGHQALAGVDFTLRRGEIHALLGENGAGKSTFIKTVTGIVRRDAGEVRLDGVPIAPRSAEESARAGIATVYQEVGLLPNLTVAQNLFLGREPTRFGLVRGRAMRQRASERLAEFGLAIEVGAPLGSFPVAVQHLVAIARAVDLSAQALILDEPTASLDTHEVTVLFGVMRRLAERGIGIVFVTHFLEQVYAITDRITVLRNGRLVTERETAQFPRLDLVRTMLGRDLAEEEARAETGPRAERTAGPPVLRAEKLGKAGYLQPVDLSVAGGEVVGLAGLLGSGRTETARLLFGAERPDQGRILLDGKPVRIAGPRDALKHRLGYCPEERKTDGIVADLTVRENIVLALQARQGPFRPLGRAAQDRIARDFIAKLDIRPPDPERPIGLLSGGNQQKALLARWLATEPRLLILDEPTRGIDVGAHAEIIRLIRSLCEAGLALLVISSELEEIVTYSDRVIVMRDRAQVAELADGAIDVTAILRAIAAEAPRTAPACQPEPA
ncbi:monosaccharide ABC transporter ATP-binding protein, CUT2 family [Methylobacterium phyllostachyos]|uniref:Monosaccharide ABC transporter ATP-binding protein, CUT2 family n=1 Tax=Methylobacterium phyllostachyos TaxID=582672 RepID=A0A1H0D674_9HYPH|nr:sugar ABC transporter ATP-binding protein [Methylobacterium phyllostachyos]SDN65585.1 monosaccharide ABC transporter ATP-binding protein, CUT2 family [Methylobacterium phyllostachyos]